MWLPSGDQAGSASKFPAFVTLSRPVPSRFTLQTDVDPLRLLTKRIFWPSGDQSGSASRTGLFAGSGVCALPFAFMVRMFSSGEIPEWYASLVPSGLHVGLPSTTGVLVRFTWFVPSG